MDTQALTNHIDWMVRHTEEHVIGPFRELAEKDPEQAIQELQNFINEALNAGNSFLRGGGYGGDPSELGIAPFLDTIGLIYPFLSPEQRAKALSECLNILDRLNYQNAQINVALINEPWLVADILLNDRALYWPGCAEYSDELDSMESWEDFQRKFQTEDGRLKCKSLCFLGFAIAWPICAAPIRERFAQEYPELTDRIKDAVATWIHTNVLLRQSRNSYQATIAEEMLLQSPEWREDLHRKLREKKWVLFPKAKEAMERRRAIEPKP